MKNTGSPKVPQPALKCVSHPTRTLTLTLEITEQGNQIQRLQVGQLQR